MFLRVQLIERKKKATDLKKAMRRARALKKKKRHSSSGKKINSKPGASQMKKKDLLISRSNLRPTEKKGKTENGSQTCGEKKAQRQRGKEAATTRARPCQQD